MEGTVNANRTATQSCLRGMDHVMSMAEPTPIVLVVIVSRIHPNPSVTMSHKLVSIAWYPIIKNRTATMSNVEITARQCKGGWFASSLLMNSAESTIPAHGMKRYDAVDKMDPSQ